MIRKIKYLLFAVVALCSTQVFALSISLDSTSSIDSGVDCEVATYRFGTNESWNGTALELLVEVFAEDNENTNGFCVGVTDGVFTVNLRDTDVGDDVAYVDANFTVVSAGTTTPIPVDRITATGFDLDKSAGTGALSTDTDDIYLSGAGAAYLSGSTNVTYSSGSFPGGHDVHMKGQTQGDCADSPATPVPSCRASASWVGAGNLVAGFSARFQNDNAYGQYDVADPGALRRLQLSLEDRHAEEVLADVDDHGDTPLSYGDASHPQVSLNTILGGGLAADDEIAFQSSVGADGDDADLVANSPNRDDEDAVFRNGVELDNQTLTAGVTEVIAITTFGDGYLTGWIDFNADGDFTDAGEKIINDTFINSTTVVNTSVNVAVPLGAVGGPTYARFRFNKISGIGHSGPGDAGEVEDYRVMIDPMTPEYNMVKTSDTSVITTAGVITYTFAFTNTGNVILSNLTVSDPNIDSGSLSGCPIATLAIGQTASCTATRTISQTQIDSATPLTNTATPTAEDPIGGAAIETSAADNSTQTTVMPSYLSTLVKPAPVNADNDASADVSVDDTLTYTITATNTGTGTLTNFVINDSIITPSTNTCPSVPPGGTCVLTGTYIVSAADVAAGVVNNSADSSSNEAPAQVASQTVPVPLPAHTIAKSNPTNADEDGSGDISAGDTLTYIVTATNSAAANLTNLVVSDPMLTPSINTCAFIAPGNTCVLTGTYVVSAADVAAMTIDNTASASSDQTVPLTDDVSTPLLSPMLAIDKPAPANTDEDGSTDVSVGDTLIYTVTATNSGTATLTNVVVTDSLTTPSSITCASVPANGTCVLTGAYTVTAADVIATTIDNTATADSDQTGPVDDTQTVTVNAPAHTLDKAAPVNLDEDGSTDVSVGDTLSYTISATNSGAATLTNLVVSDPMITPNTTTCAFVAPAATCVLTGTYAVTAADVTAGSIVNTASSDSDQTDPLDDTETVVVPSPSLALDKPFPANGDQDGSGDVSVGDVLTYTVTATNNGAATLTNVLVSDPLITPASSSCALVAPNGTCVLTGTYTVTAADVAAGMIDNTATADSDQTDPVDDTQSVNLDAPSHVLDKAAPANSDEDGSTDLSAGDTLTYTITATNNGDASLTNLVVSDPMITPNTISCALVAPTATCVLTGIYTVTAADVAAGNIVNTASSDSDQTDPIEDTETVVVPSPLLALDKAAPANADEDGSTDLSVGDTLTYTITATNNGAATLTNMVVSDPMITPNTTTCALVAPTATCVLTGVYSVTAADVTAGSIINTASADSDQTDPIDDTETVVVPSPSLALDKPFPVNGDQDGSGDVSVGDVLTYTITATNDGAATLTNVLVSDPLITPASISCTSVAPNGTCVLTGTYTVTAADVAAGIIDNTATADSDQTDPVDDTQSVNLDTPSLALDKAAPTNTDEDGSTDLSVGDTLTYTITATNNGAASLTNLVVSDPKITPSTTTCALVAPTATCVLTGVYSVTAADVAAGSIVNTASSDSDQTGPIDDTENVVVPSPSLALDKPFPANDDQDGSGDVSVGDVLTYTITATNNGAATLTNVLVSDPLITPASSNCPLVAPAATCVLTGSYTVTAADVVAGMIDNTATADSDQTDPVDDTQSVNLDAPSHALDKAAPANADEDGSTDLSVGDTLTYTITATNNGAAVLTNLVVSDPMITPNTTTCAMVAPTATCVLSGTYTVTAADVAAGTIVNTANSDSDQTGPLDDTETVVVPSPSLALDKPFPVNGDQDGSSDVSVGDVLTYTVTATNNGAATLTNVLVSDPLITPTSASCALVAPNGTCVLTGTYTVTAADVVAGMIDNTASADSDQTGPVDDVQTVNLDAPSLVLDKAVPANADEDGSTDFSVGDTLTYTITATNDGAATLTNLVVSDSMISPNSTACAVVGPAATCVLSGTYTVTAADVAAGTIVNTASSDSDQTDPIDDTETVVVPSPSLALDKPFPANGDQDGSGDVSVGDILTYTITATNDGAATLTNVLVSDPLITPASSSCASLVPGATCVLAGTYTVTATDVAAGRIDNTAKADSDQTDPVDDTQSVNLDAPGHVLDKAAPVNADEDGSSDLSVGDTLTYTITATNNGAATLTNLIVSDPMITPGTTTCALVAPTATCVLSGTYSVTAADVTAGSIVNTASSDSDQTDPIDDTETVVVPTPSLALVKPFPASSDEDGSGDLSVGDVLTYTITATNNGSATLTNVVVSDPLITPTSASCASLAPNATCILTGTYTVTAADVAAGMIDNTAIADSDQTDAVDDTQLVSLNAPSHILDKAAPANADEDSSTDISVGDTLSYTITATNNGAATLTNFNVSDPMITPNTINCAQVAPAATCTLTGTYSVTAADVATGSIVNTASSDSDQTDPLDDTETVMVPAPSLALDKAFPANGDQDASGDVSVGDVLTYTITATNNGSATLTNVVVSDPLIVPTNTSCASVVPNATCVLIGTYSVTAADVAAGTIDNTATADSDQTGPVDDTQSLTLNAPDLALDKAAPVNTDEDGTSDLSAGDTLTYTVTATNSGSSNLTNVVVSDPMLTPNTTTCASVAQGGTCVLTGTYAVTAADVIAGTITNTAAADSDQTDPVEDTEVVAVPTPSHVLAKAAPANADEDGSTDISVGDTLSYTITATNNGTATLTNLVVSDAMIIPSNVSCATVSPTETCVLTGSYTVTASDIAAGSIVNTASSDSDQTDPVDDTETVIAPVPSLVLDKPYPTHGDRDGSTDISVGDVLTYTITATNNGTATLTNVVVTDPLITPTSNTCASLTTGGTCVLSGTYTVTASDVAAGMIDNTATADSDQTNPVDDSQSVPVLVPAMALNKAAPANSDEDGSADVSIGDTLTYTITATNTGTAVLTNVMVNDPLLTPGSTGCASVAAGATCVLTGSYTVVAADVAAGVINNTATADSDQTDPLDDTEVVAVPMPSHTLDKSLPVNTDEDNSGDISAADTLTYTVTATNNGTATLTNLVVNDSKITPNSIACASVAAGGTCVLVGTYTTTAADVVAGQIDNIATSDSDQTDPVDDSQSVVLNAPSLALDKAAPVNTDEDGSGDVSVADTLTYTVTASNNGSSNLTNVVVSDPMLTPNTITCATVVPGATCVLTGIYTVTPADVVAGQIDNTAGADSDQTDPMDDSEVVIVPTPAFALDKAAPVNADEDGSADVSVGDTLTYTITATNNGTASLTNLIVNDSLLTPATSTCANVAPAATCVLTGTYTVTSADVAAGQISNTATADSDQTDPLSDTEVVPVPEPSHMLVKSSPVNADEDGSSDVSVGDTLTYTIVATNDGTARLTNLVVNDSMISPNTITCATVSVGATCILTGTYSVTAADVAAGQISNTATSGSDQTGPVDDTEDLILNAPSLALDKAAPVNADEDSSTDISVSDTLSYTITATNNGASNLTNVVVSDPMLMPNTKTCAVLTPGSTCLLTGAYSVVAADVVAAAISNTATAVSDQTDQIGDTEVVPVPTPSHILSKALPVNSDEDNSGDVSVADTLTYSVTATNDGTATLTNLVVNDSMITPNSISCAIVAPGATCVLVGTYTTTAADVAAGQIDNTATSDSDQTDPVDATQTVVLNAPSLALVKVAPVNSDEDGSADVSAGDTLTYTIIATNNGSSNLTNLVVSDPMISPNTITCATVAPGGTCVLIGTYGATAADVAAGQIDNTASADSDQTDPIDDTHSLPLEMPALTLVKAAPVNADEDGSADVSAGDTLTYTITATNSGSSNLTNLVVSDSMISPNTTTCATVAPGATCVLIGTYGATAADVAAGQIDNTASADSDQTDPIVDTHSLPLSVPDLTLVKGAPVNADEDSSTDVSVDDTLTYTITATNNGGSNLTNVVVGDPLITPNTTTCLSVVPGATCVLVGTYKVTAADVVAGQIDNTASANSDQTNSIDDSEVVPVPTPAHVLVKAVPVNTDEDNSGDISVGDTLSYTITATNTGTAMLTNLVISDSMITPTSEVCASVSPNNTCVLTGSHVVTAADVASGQIVNTATSDTDQTGPVSDTQTVVLNAPSLMLVKSAPVNADEDASADVSAGDTLTYTITATNNGSSSLTNLVVSDPMINPNTLSCALVATGGSCVLVGTYVVTPADVAAEVINNTATADSDQTAPVDDQHALPLGAPSLALVKLTPANADEDGSNDVSAGDTLTYTITATNNGLSNLTDVMVSDQMISPNSTGCTLVAAGARCVLTGTYVVTSADVAAGKIDNTASANSNQTGPVSDVHSLPLAIPGLLLSKAAPVNADEDGSGDVSVGDTFTYTITATNSGMANLTDVVVNDPKIGPNTITCASVAPQATCVLTGTYVVSAADATAGQVINTATAGSDQTGPVADSVTVPVPAASITLLKSLASNADEDGTADITVGDTLTYSSVATNTGSAVLTNVVVSDPLVLPASVTCAILAPQETCVLTGAYMVADADVAAGGIVNTATVISDQLDPLADSHTVAIATPELSIVKGEPVNADTDNSESISVGDVLTYTVTATNTGNTVLTNVEVTDSMIRPSSVTCNVVPQASTCVLTGALTVSANDAVAGGIVNTATVDSDQTGPVADSNTVVVIKLLPPVTQSDSKTDLPLGQSVTIDVLADDSDPESNIDPATVVILDPATGNPVTALVVSGEGTWTVDPVTGAITFTPEEGFMGDPNPIEYTVTDTTGLVSNPSTVTLDYEAPASLSGTVWLDADRDGEIDPEEPVKAGWTLKILDDQGNLLATTVTDAEGKYKVEHLIPGEYTVQFYNEAGVFIAESTTDGPVTAGANVDLPLPIDPSGIVYDSVTREPIPGVTLQFVNSAGMAVDASCLNTNQQNQVTQADGFYAFDVFPDAHPSCPDGDTYSIEIANVPSTYNNQVSRNIPPQAGVFDSAANETDCTVDAYPLSNACEIQANSNAPKSDQDTRYYLSFSLNSGDSNVIFNHLPLDPFIVAALADMRLQKTVSKTSASAGDVLYYTVIVQNELADATSDVAVTDDLPRGFRFVEGSANVTTFDSDSAVLSKSQVTTIGADPVVFTRLTVPGADAGVIAINYAVRVGAGVVPGSHTNTAQVTEGGSSNIGKATVRLVSDPVLDQATIIGKVFHDRDSDGYQDDALATNITIKSDYFGWSSLKAGDLAGRNSRQEPLADHQLVINMPLSVSNRFEITTAEGTFLSVDDDLQITESHVGKRAHGLTAQDLQISVRKAEALPTPAAGRQASGVTRVLEITISNIGINEEGMPGVRLASVTGLVVESDQAGRFHIPDPDSGEYRDGQQFILKLDATTLPNGATLTTENPRVIRITNSALNVMNFGVSVPEPTPSMAAARPASRRIVQVQLGSVFFDTDKHGIRADQRGAVQDIITKLKKFQRGHILIEAHTDRRHSKEYNIALAERRARTVERELRGILGNEVMDQVVVEVDPASYREMDNTNKVEQSLETEQ